MRHDLEGLRWRGQVATDSTNSARRATSSRSCLTSEEVETPAAIGGGSGRVSATVGVATSITLSASSASLFRSMELSVDASTIRTLAGNR